MEVITAPLPTPLALSITDRSTTLIVQDGLLPEPVVQQLQSLLALVPGDCPEHRAAESA